MPDFKALLLKLKIKLYSPSAIQYYQQLLRNQYMSDDELYQLNWEKRKKILLHAWDNTPYYREKYSSEGLRRQDILSITPDEFLLLPVLTRREIKNNFNTIITTNISKRYLRLITTGGSTGEPLSIFHDKRFYGEVLVWRMLSWWGVSYGANQAIAWRITRKSWTSRFINTLIWWPTRRIHLDASSMSESAVNFFIRKFNYLRPPLLKGYVGAIDHLANVILEKKINIHSPEAVWVTAAPLSQVHRKRIESAFKAPVYDQYAFSEIFWVAAQCSERKGLHIFSDARHVEFLNEIGKPSMSDELGRIVVTDLENYAFPLIRYENGDLGKALANKCTCGINLPLMDSVRGRISDNVYLPDGTVISGEYLTTIFDDFPDAVTAFQIYQISDYSLVIKVVPNRKFQKFPYVREHVRQTLYQKVYGQVNVTVKIVDEIISDRGKTRFVVSEIR